MDERVKQFIDERTTEIKTQESEYREKILAEAGLGKTIFLDDMPSEQKESIDISQTKREWDETLSIYRDCIIDYPELSDEEFYKIEELVNKNKYDKSERIYNSLWAWSKSLKTWGLIFFLAIVIVGLIFSIIASQPPKIDSEIAFYNEIEYSKEFNGIAFLMSFIKYIFAGIITNAVFNTLSLLVGALASIVENTKKIAENTRN